MVDRIATIPYSSILLAQLIRVIEQVARVLGRIILEIGGIVLIERAVLRLSASRDLGRRSDAGSSIEIDRMPGSADFDTGDPRIPRDSPRLRFGLVQPGSVQ